MNLATIVIVGDNPASTGELADNLSRLGFTVKSLLESSNLGSLASAPDIVLVAGENGNGAQVETARRIRSTPGIERVPICLLTDARTADLLAQAFAVGVDDVLTLPLDGAKLLARLRPLVRLSTMNHEFLLRCEEAGKIGIPCSSGSFRVETGGTCRLLIVGQVSAELEARFPGAEITIASDPYQADALLNGSSYDAAILAPSGDPVSFLDLCANLRNNPRLFLLPVLVADVEGTMTESDAYRHKANDYFGHPVEFGLVAEAIKFLVRRQRQRWAFRNGLLATMGEANLDASTGLYSKAFLKKYLAGQVQFASRHKRHLSVILLRIADISRIRHQFGKAQAAHLKKQLAQWITGLARVEDFAAISAENEFCLVLADTPREEAAIVMHRIAGALAYTDFAVRDVYQPVKVWVQESCAEYQDGEKANGFLDRIRNNMS